MGVCSLFRLRSASLSIYLPEAGWWLRCWAMKKKRNAENFRSAIVSPQTHRACSLFSSFLAWMSGRKWFSKSLLEKGSNDSLGIGPSIPPVYWNPSFALCLWCTVHAVVHYCVYHLLLLQYYILYSVTCLYRRFYWWCAARVDLPLFRSYLLRISREILLARIFYCVGGFT
jgi:hypothetical protein